MLLLQSRARTRPRRKMRQKMNVHGQTRPNMTGVFHGLMQRGEVLV